MKSTFCKKTFPVILVFLFLLIYTDTVYSNNSSEKTVQKYICVAHTRTDSNPSLDPDVESFDFSEYKMLLLGGDLAYLTSFDRQTIEHVDSILDLGNKNTLWALGNHDYDDLDLVQEITKRPVYYAYTNYDITFVVLDTQDSLSNFVGAQMQLIKEVTDTITHSTCLILLHHKLIWMYGDSALEPMTDSISNVGIGDDWYEINENNFYQDVYPRLVEVRNRGIKVICIGGDIGFSVSEFEYTKDNDIHFLATGNSYKNDNKRLLQLNHDLEKKTIDWEYIPLPITSVQNYPFTKYNTAKLELKKEFLRTAHKIHLDKKIKSVEIYSCSGRKLADLIKISDGIFRVPENMSHNVAILKYEW